MQMVFYLLFGRIKKPTYSWQKPPTGCGICRALKSTDKKFPNETNYNSFWLLLNALSYRGGYLLLSGPPYETRASYITH